MLPLLWKYTRLDWSIRHSSFGNRAEIRFLLAMWNICYRSEMRTLFFIAAMVAMNSLQVFAEPFYQGKPESYWVNLLTNLNSYQTQKNWRELGTNARTVLLKAIDVRDVPNAGLIRSNAGWTLQHYSDAAILIPIARQHFDPQVRAFALCGLVFNADKSVTAAEVDSLRDTNATVRNAGIAGLGLDARQFIPGELPALVKCLQDFDPEVRTAAAMILVNYQYTGLTNPSENEVNSAAFSEIEKATASSNACISNAANTALKQVAPYFVLGAYAHELWLSTEEITGTSWTATLRVVDENNKPVADADAAVEIYIHDLDFYGHVNDRTEEITGKTDANGVFTASHKGFCPSAFNAGKNGYIPVRSKHDMLSFKDNDPEKWNPKVTLVLKKN